MHKIRVWKLVRDEYIPAWLRTWEYLLIVVSVLVGGCLSTIEFANSRFLHVPFFRMGLSLSELNKIQRQRIVTVVFFEVCLNRLFFIFGFRFGFGFGFG